MEKCFILQVFSTQSALNIIQALKMILNIKISIIMRLNDNSYPIMYPVANPSRVV